MIMLVIRGHIRNSFNTKELYNFVKEIYSFFPDLHIYIHTWSVYANNVSWRKISTNNSCVNEEVINNYFDNLKHLIKHIIIDNDSEIKLEGNLLGNINKGPMPIVGWKNYWYGKHKIMDFIYNTETIDKKAVVINTRFDLFSNSNTINKTSIISLIKNNDKKEFTKNIFLFDDEQHTGIDNIYIGNVNTMYNLCYRFHYHLDEILSKNNDTIHQEYLVYRINSKLFAN